MPCRINTSAAWICNALWGGLERERGPPRVITDWPKYRTILTVITISSQSMGRQIEEIIFFPLAFEI